MFFATPLWLAALVPWAGVTALLLLGRRQRIAVPFVQLWKGPTDGPRASPALTRPPLHVLLTILALLLCVLGTARPMLRSHHRRIALIVDRGINMVLSGNATVDESLFNAVEARFGEDAVNVIGVPTAITSATPPLVSTELSLPAEVRQQLDSPNDLVLVNTDQRLNIDDPRLLVIPPSPAKGRPAIIDVAARADPKPQVMVKLRDITAAGSIEVKSDTAIVTQPISSAAGEQTVFIDLPSLARNVSIRLKPFDTGPQGSAFLCQESSDAHVDAGAGATEPLRRMVDIYNRHRRTSDAGEIQIVTGDRALPADRPAVWLSDVPGMAGPPPQVRDHPITSDVKFPPITGTTPPPGWLPIVTSGNSALVAIKDGPSRQVWVCINDLQYPSTPAYVIFWTNVFDWLAGDRSEFRWHPVTEWSSADGGEPTTGIFRQTDGTYRAFNAIGIQLPAVETNQWQQRLDQMETMAGATLDLTPTIYIAASVLTVLALLISTSRARSTR